MRNEPLLQKDEHERLSFKMGGGSSREVRNEPLLSDRSSELGALPKSNPSRREEGFDFGKAPRNDRTSYSCRLASTRHVTRFEESGDMTASGRAGGPPTCSPLRATSKFETKIKIGEMKNGRKIGFLDPKIFGQNIKEFNTKGVIFENQIGSKITFLVNRITL